MKETAGQEVNVQTESDLTGCCLISGNAVTSVSPYGAAAAPCEHPIWLLATSVGNHGNRVRNMPQKNTHTLTHPHTPEPRLSP